MSLCCVCGLSFVVCVCLMVFVVVCSCWWRLLTVVLGVCRSLCRCLLFGVYGLVLFVVCRALFVVVRRCSVFVVH